MKSKTISAILLALSLFLSGCFEPEELQLLSWKDNAVRLSVIKGSATTPDFWKIYFHKNGSKRYKVIFQSISSPYIESISIAGDNLLIHCGASGSKEQRIEINLKYVDDFVDNPVKYRRSILEQTNESYHEPEFIRKDRAIHIK